MYMNDGNKTKINLRNKSVFITGVAGFIGSSLAKRLLSTVEGVKVVGLDNMNHYYDVRLKEARLNELEQFDNFSFVKGNLADKAVIESIFEQYKPEIVVNLGAQAGVRYSITNPDAYVEANLIGFYNILEACRHSYDEGHTPVEHLVYASSSSVYGSNKKVPYSTDDKVDNPVSLYAATKKSNELMAHASRCNNFHGNVAARMNSINANKDTFKMYTDMFLTEYIILAIHLNSQGALSDVVLNKVKKNANLMI